MSIVKTIPAEHNFIDTLAQDLLSRFGADQLALSDITLFLPSRRAVIAMQAALLRFSEAKTSLLPRIYALGDADELSPAELLDLPAEIVALSNLPPAISPAKRQLILARLIMNAPGLFAKEPFLQSLPQALQMAQELARLIDQSQTENLNLDALDALVEEKDFLSEHWQKVLGFLDILRVHWPNILAQMNLMDPAQRRHQLICARATYWQSSSKLGKIIIAGSTGSILATRALMRAVLASKMGELILPALDQESPEKVWQVVAEDPNHPQYGLARLLKTLGIERQDVVPVTRNAQTCSQNRPAFFSKLMIPAAMLDDPDYGWKSEKALFNTALENFEYLEAANPAQEAEAIALAIRDALEVPSQTIALVTTDRLLSRRVQNELARWGIVANDSAGTPLKNTKQGTFMRLAAEAMAQRFSPIPLLALLKHPLARLGKPSSKQRIAVRLLEGKVLRRVKLSGNGLLEIKLALEEIRSASEINENDYTQIKNLIDHLIIIAPKIKNNSLLEMLRNHIDFASKLSEDDNKKNALYQEDAGLALGQSLDALLEDETALKSLTLSLQEYPQSYDSLIGEVTVRMRHGTHPRVSILGSIEARLQRADVMILGGLNEGSWPTPTDSGPWMSRPMRQRYGLPPAERKIGLSAHDFTQSCCAKRVLLCRSSKDSGAETIPSRWLSRLFSLKTKETLKPKKDYLGWTAQMSIQSVVPRYKRPAPKPPLAARPRTLSVTNIERFMRDPYAIFARHILKLYKLEEVDNDAAAAHKGNVIHQAIERFTDKYPKSLPTNAAQKLRTIAETLSQEMLRSPLARTLWMTRLDRLSKWYCIQEAPRRSLIAKILSEQKGILTLASKGGPFYLTAKADRLDLLKNDTLVVLDYKSGNTPTKKDVREGLSPQLTLTALIALGAGFKGLNPKAIAELSYWKLSGGRISGNITSLETPSALVEAAEAGLLALISAFDHEEQAYLALPNLEKAPAYNDYAHLERIEEWSI